ncbi:MAG: type VI secretion system membrane subunit TssM [Desulfovibrio sp.]|jgi:type VI secretion system protein ImpL|nr:type VI secretion system membrane subunit TssM [Desulfovibrio sp.]
MITRFFRALFDILKTPWVLLLLLTLLLILFVWLVGPLVAVAGHVLLDGVTARLVATIILIFFWGLFVALSASRQRKKALAEPGKAEELEKEMMSRNLLREEVDYIKERLRAAIKTVTTSNFYGARGRSRYTLPWYLVLGTSNCGKTSFLLNSGLKFPLNEQADRHLYTLKSTERCEILYGNDAVFVDTPGTYAGSRPETPIHKIWTALLRKLFSIRPARPLNGIIVCVSMRDIIDADQARREHLGRTIRTRLGETLKALRSYVPVYLVFTKCDAVQGFAQFFTHLSRSERGQVFGCPSLTETMEPGAVRTELKALMQTLNTQIIPKIHQERDVAARGEMFRFPQELATLGPRIEDFINEAFGPSRYHKPVMFRGFFFTCALSSHDVMAAAAREGELSFQQGFAATVGDYAKGFFIDRLLERHIIPEARLAATDKEQLWGIRLRRYGMQFAAAALFLFAGIFLSASFMNNYSRLETLDAIYAAFSKEQKAVPAIVDAKVTLPELATLARSVTVYEPGEDSAIGYGLGLYQGKTFDRASKAAYLGTLNSRFMPPIRNAAAEKVERSLNDPQTLKSALRAYLMLCQPRYLNVKFINEWLEQQWSARYMGQADVQAGLRRHMDYLIAHGIVPVEPDADLVDRARKALLKIPLAELVYQRMQEEAVESGRPPFTFRAAIGESPFSGDTTAIPALYTREGYEEFLIKRCPGIIRNLTGESWIFGANPLTLSVLDVGRVHKEVRVMYFRDYTKYWNQAVQALQIRTPSTIADARNLAARLTTGTPPAVLVLREIIANTDFIIADEAPGEVSEAVKGEAARKAQEKLGRKTGNKIARAVVAQGSKNVEELRKQAQEEAQREAAAVRQYFLPLESLLDSSGNPNPPLQAVNTNMVNTGDYFARLLASDNRDQRILTALLEIAEEKDDTLRRMESSAEHLPAPVRGWYATVVAGGLRDMLNITARNINRAYQGQVLSIYDKTLRSHYPFTLGAERDVGLNEFTEFFRAGGILDNFYDVNLRPFVTRNGMLLSIMGRTLPLSGQAVAQLQRANRVQDAFFMSGRELTISILMEPYALDASLKRVSLDYAGKSIKYWHGPVQGAAFTWPAGSGQSTSAILEFDDLHDIVSKNETRGEWALFRLLQGGSIKRQEGGTCLIEVQKNGKWAQFLIQFRNKANPFDPTVCSFTLPEMLLP